jgi:hypothetical protein
METFFVAIFYFETEIFGGYDDSDIIIRLSFTMIVFQALLSYRFSLFKLV